MMEATPGGILNSVFGKYEGIMKNLKSGDKVRILSEYGQPEATVTKISFVEDGAYYRLKGRKDNFPRKMLATEDEYEMILTLGLQLSHEELLDLVFRENILDLTKFLKTGKKIYSISDGDLIVSKIEGDLILCKKENSLLNLPISFWKSGVRVGDSSGKTTLYPDRDSFQKYPFFPEMAWKEWKKTTT